MIRVLIGEDHAIVRAGLRQMLALEPDIEVADEARDGHQILALLDRLQADVLLTDMSMPGPSGIELVRAVRAAHPALPILVLSMHGDVQVVSRVLRAGASGYVTKDSDPALLARALRRTAAGERYVDPDLAQRMVLDSTSSVDPELVSLSNREYQVLAASARGVSPAALAQQLGVSVKTVSAHKIRLMRKLGFTSTAQMVRYAIERGIVE